MTASMLPVRNPRTGEYDYEMPVTSADDIQSIAAGLRAAQMQWSALGVEGNLYFVVI